MSGTFYHIIGKFFEFSVKQKRFARMRRIHANQVDI